jgi:hypothetical protein
MSSIQSQILTPADDAYIEATKNVGMSAVPIKVLLNISDFNGPKELARIATIVDSMRLQTREGPAVIDVHAVLCQGPAGEYWQQAPGTVQANYIAGEKDGIWTHYDPRPGRIVDVYRVTEEDAQRYQYIQGLWGTTVDGVPNLHKIQADDYVGRDPANHADRWVIAKAIYHTTYGPVKTAEPAASDA